MAFVRVLAGRMLVDAGGCVSRRCEEKEAAKENAGDMGPDRAR